MTARPSRKNQYGVYREPTEIHKEPVPLEVRMEVAPHLVASVNGLELWRKGDSITITESHDGRTRAHAREPRDLSMTLTQWRHLVREAGTQ